ncbi:hypothetical protein CDCA_CDCA10G3082 [Cyanidium caldarium]|uniref:Peptidase M50 domain-containing protein n=1 Tax=Cyanidium caldarium TaxID=2771 RepID=A0AAV9IXP3_CYACA|nr:hypothetical protein CDCA_CDCA10G3082 [Cyanidium caldarium]
MTPMRAYNERTGTSGVQRSMAHQRVTCIPSRNGPAFVIPVVQRRWTTGRSVSGERRCAPRVGRRSLACRPPRKISISRRHGGVSQLGMLGISEAGVNLSGLVVLAGVIVIHEMGHFIAARSRGIRVKEFSVGFGPPLFSFKPRDGSTQFSLRLLPFGGYVAFPEEEQVDAETGKRVRRTDPDLLENRPVRDRLLVASGGVLANVALAWALLFGSIETVGIVKTDFQPGVQVVEVTGAEVPAARAGLHTGDMILAVDGEPLSAGASSPQRVVDAVARANAGDGRASRDVVLTLKGRGMVRVHPQGGKIGARLRPNVITHRERVPLDRAVPVANAELVALFRSVVSGFALFFTHTSDMSGSVSGPIGVATLAADIAREDAASLPAFAAAISANLAIINALPLPALDGGHLVFLLIESIRGRPVPREIQRTINGAALTVLLMLSLVLLVGDIEKLVLPFTGWTR